MASRRPSKKPPTKSRKPPPRPSAIDVDPSWLLAEPPPMPKLPPLPKGIAPRRETMEVKLEWLEDEEEPADPKARKRAAPPPIPREDPTSDPMRASHRPPRKRPPPIPREEPDEPPKRASKSPSKSPSKRPTKRPSKRPSRH